STSGHAVLEEPPARRVCHLCHLRLIARGPPHETAGCPGLEGPIDPMRVGPKSPAPRRPHAALGAAVLAAGPAAGHPAIGAVNGGCTTGSGLDDPRGTGGAASVDVHQV